MAFPCWTWQEMDWSHILPHHWRAIWIPDRRSVYPRSQIKLPQRSDSFSVLIFEKMYIYTNAITLRLAYIAEREKDMTGALSQEKNLHGDGSLISLLEIPGSVCKKDSGSGGGWSVSTWAEFVHHGRKR